MHRSRFMALSAQISSRFSARCRRINPTQRLETFNYHGSTEKSTRYSNHKNLPVAEPEPSPSWKDHIIAPIAVLVIAGGGLYLHYNDERRATPVGFNKDITNKVDRPAIGGKFKLIDTANNLVTESDFRGNWVLMYFAYTSSPDVCPLEVQKMTQVIHILGWEHNLRITPVFITIDPERDSPSQLGAYLSEFDAKIVGLTGPIAAIRQMAHEYRVYFKKVDEEGKDDYLVESSNNMYLLDPNMETVKYFGSEYDATQLADGIVNEVKKVLN